MVPGVPAPAPSPVSDPDPLWQVTLHTGYGQFRQKHYFESKYQGNHHFSHTMGKSEKNVTLNVNTKEIIT